MAKVLVTGATGFVGKRLILSLLAEGHEVYAMCRVKGTPVFIEQRPGLFYVFGDVRNPETFLQIPKDIDAAYYLVHSMSGIVANLPNAEAEAAEKFVEGLAKTDVRQIIYLGGIINDPKALSPHLSSRLLVEKVLAESSIPTTVLRASLIIGEGSASFEILRDLCEKLPLMVVPKWVHTPCQPIAIKDVLFYLTKVLLNPACYHQTFDIGGPEVVTFKQLMQKYAAIRGIKIKILEVPFLTPRLSSYWLFFVTSVRFSICYYLVESMKSSTIVKLDGIQALLPHTCMRLEQALTEAIESSANHEVISTWMDSWEIAGLKPDIKEYLPVDDNKCFRDQRCVPIQTSRDAVIERIWKIGGQNGYYTFNWAWRLRGMIDKLFGGIGLNRGRRDPYTIQAGDSIDFWRVLVADKAAGGSDGVPDSPRGRAAAGSGGQGRGLGGGQPGDLA